MMASATLLSEDSRSEMSKATLPSGKVDRGRLCMGMTAELSDEEGIVCLTHDTPFSCYLAPLQSRSCDDTLGA